MMMDVDQAAKAMRDPEMAAEIEEDFIEDFNQPTYRGHADRWGPGAGLVEPAWLEPGCSDYRCHRLSPLAWRLVIP